MKAPKKFSREEIRALRGSLKRKPGEKPFAERWADYKREEKELEEAKFHRWFGKGIFAVFTEIKSERQFHVPVGHVWTGVGLNDIHIQFESGGGHDNYLPTQNLKGLFVVPYRGKTYDCNNLSFRATPPCGSRLLSVKKLKSEWVSPNR